MRKRECPTCGHSEADHGMRLILFGTTRKQNGPELYCKVRLCRCASKVKMVSRAAMKKPVKVTKEFEQDFTAR